METSQRRSVVLRLAIHSKQLTNWRPVLTWIPGEQPLGIGRAGTASQSEATRRYIFFLLLFFILCGVSLHKGGLRRMVLASHTPPHPWDFTTPGVKPRPPSAFERRLIFMLLYFWICPPHPGIEKKREKKALRPQTFTAWLPFLCESCAQKQKHIATVRWAAATYERLLNLPGNITLCVRAAWLCVQRLILWCKFVAGAWQQEGRRSDLNALGALLLLCRQVDCCSPCVLHGPKNIQVRWIGISELSVGAPASTYSFMYLPHCGHALSRPSTPVFTQVLKLFFICIFSMFFFYFP